MRKKLICFILAMMIGLQIFAVPASAAAPEISEDDLYSKYPLYLSNSDICEATSKAEAACFAVINSYDESDTAVALCMTAMKEGISLTVQDNLSKLGLTDSLYDSYLKEAAKGYIQEYLSSDTALSKTTNKVSKAFSALKTSYAAASGVSKNEILSSLRELSKDRYVKLSAENMDKVVDKIYGSDSIKKTLDGLDGALDIWKLAVEVAELYSIETESLDFVIDELEKSEQTGSDLYRGLKLLKADCEKDPSAYILKSYCTDKGLKHISKCIEDWFYGLAGAPAATVAAVKAFSKFFATVVYSDAHIDKIIQSIMHMSFVSSFDICLTQYRIKFMNGTAAAEDIENYRALFACSMAEYSAACSAANACAKLNDKWTLGGDCDMWAEDFRCYYTYDNYIKWCTETVKHDIANEMISSDGESNISDALNEATIAERLEKIYGIYTPNEGKVFNGYFDGTSGSLGFAAMVFNMIFDKKFRAKVDNRYEYILTNEANVRLVGRLEEGELTENSVKKLFSGARIGDVVLTSGKDRYLHAMVVAAVGEDSAEVYDSDSKFYSSGAKAYEIRKYNFSYADMAESFNSHGKYNDKAGISVYRAVVKINQNTSSAALSYDERLERLNFVIENGVLTNYKGNSETVNIPDGVTEIGEKCFSGNEKIKYVNMPDTVTLIGFSAFSNCKNLVHVKLSGNIKEIYGGAFIGCKSLTSVYFPDSLYAIWGSAFAYTGLSSVRFPDNLGLVEYFAFEDCQNIRTVTLGRNMGRMASDVFPRCDNLETVYFNAENVLNMDGAFSSAGENNGFEVIFGDNVTEIPDHAMSGAGYLNMVTIPDSVKKIGSYAFAYCYSLNSITIPKNVEYLQNNIFTYSRIKTVQLNAENLISAEEAFSAAGGNYDDVLEIKIGDNVKSIPDSMFKGCSSLREIRLPVGLQTIGEDVFAFCSNLNTIYWAAESAVKTGSGSLCSLAGNMTVIFEDTVKSIPDRALENCSNAEKIIIGKNVRKIGNKAFYGCDGIETLEISDSVEEIGSGVITYCSGLKEFRIPKAMKDDGMIYGLKSLENMYVSPENPNFTGVSGCIYKGKMLVYIPQKKTDLYIPADCTEVDWTAGCEKNSIRKIHIADGNKCFSQGNGVLYNYDKTELVLYGDGNENTSFSVPDGVTAIWSLAFCGSVYLENIYVPDTVNFIGSTAFGGCEKLSGVRLPNGLEEISAGLFSGSLIREIRIPDGVTKISENAFEYCDNLESIYIPGSVKIVEKNAFYECPSLKNVYCGLLSKDRLGIEIEEQGNETVKNANYVFNECTVDGKLINVKLAVAPGEKTNVYAASYADDGRMLEVKKVSEQSVSLSVENVSKVKILYIEQGTLKPLSDVSQLMIVAD